MPRLTKLGYKIVGPGNTITRIPKEWARILYGSDISLRLFHAKDSQEVVAVFCQA
jgi:hypothetical protein